MGSDLKSKLSGNSDLKSFETPSLSVLSEREKLIEIMEKVNQISLTNDLTSLFNQMLGLMGEICDAEMELFYLLDSTSDEMVIISVGGEIANPSFKGLRFNKELGILGQAASNRKPIIVGDLVHEQHWLKAIDPGYASDLKNFITLPLSFNQTFIGAVQLFNYQREELDLLQVLGERLILEIDKKIILKGSQQSNQKLRNLIDVLQQVSGNLDRERLLHLVTEQASQLLGAERSSVFLADSDDTELNFQVSYKSNSTKKENQVKPNEETVFNIFRNKHRQKDQDLGNEKPLSRGEGGFGFTTRSAITVPLQTQTGNNADGKTKTQTFGGLMVLNKLEGDFSREDNHLLNILAAQTSSFLQIVEIFDNANDLFLGVVKSLVTAIDAKDPYTQGHSLRVSELSVGIAEEMGLNDNLINDIRVGSLLHDIGKIGIPDEILKKKGALSNKEYHEIKKHTVVGHNIMRQARALQAVLPAIIGHHERLDGSGYPYGLRMGEIPLMSRIVAVADVFDAMASERPYRAGMPIPTVTKFLQNAADVFYDRACVEAMVRLIDREKVMEIFETYKYEL